MTAIDFIEKLKDEYKLTDSEVSGIKYVHLKSPCEIKIPESITNKLKKEYEPEVEKGGVFFAKPHKVDNKTILIIVEVYFIENISEKPENSYLPNQSELQSRIDFALSDSSEKLLPIRFHTHPTHSDNITNEIFNYIFQSDTSEQDRIVSYQTMRVEDVNLLTHIAVIQNGILYYQWFHDF